MKVTFLGTGTSQGVPVIGCTCVVCNSLDFRDKRLRVSIHIAFQNKSIVIDSGPDFRQQILRERITRLDALLFTHEHKDHTAGMDDIRSFNFIQRSKIPIYARSNVLRQLKQEFYYVFEDTKYPGVPEVVVHEIENKKFDVQGIPVIPIEVFHYRLPVFGFRIGDFTYITDANHIALDEMEKIKGSKIIVLSALQKEPHISHYTLAEAVEVLKLLKPEKAYLTHISHKLGSHAHVSRELPEFIELAYDGLQVELSDAG